MSDTYSTPEHGWTCFHCGETFPPTYEGQINAKRHFGFDVYATPGCIEKLTAPERRLLLQIPALQENIKRLEAQIDDEFSQLFYARLESEIRGTAGVFRNCRTLRDVFNLYDSMEGRALAAEERLAQTGRVHEAACS